MKNFSDNTILRYLRTGNNRILFSNISWHVLEYFLKIISGIFIGLWLAAYLGPEKLGLYAYALSFLALFGPLITLGYDGFLGRDLLNDEAKNYEILGTSFLLRFTGALLAIFLIWLLLTFTNWFNANATSLIMLMSLSYFFQTADVIEVYFRNKLKARYASLARILALAGAAGIRIYLIINKASLMAFAITYVIEFGLAALFLVGFYLKSRKEIVGRWKISYSRIRFVLSESWPLFISAFSYILYTRIDQIMLGNILSEAAVGIYSVSVKFYELPIALILIINVSVFPFQAKQFQGNRNVFFKYYQLLTEAYTLFAYCVFVFILLFASLIIQILPESYNGAAALMQIHFIGLIFIFNAAVRNAWMSLEGYQKYLLLTTLISAGLNIVLNYFMIPQMGVSGAAWATVISQIFSLFLLNLFFKPLRKAFYIQLKAFFPYLFFKHLREVLPKR